MFADKRSDPIGLIWQVTETIVTSVRFTSRKLSVDFVQGAYLELLINSDLNFELKLEQKIPVKCLLEGRDVFFFFSTGFEKSFFFSHVLHITAIKQKKIWEREYPNSVVLVICPLIGLIENQIRKDNVSDLFSDNPWPQLLFASAEKAPDNDFNNHKDRSSEVPQPKLNL